MDRHDVWVANSREHSRFGKEALGDGRLRCELGVSGLHRHPTIEGEVYRPKYNAHAASAELALEAVLRLQHGLKVGEQIGNRLAHGICWSDVRVERREDGSKNARKEFDAARVRNVASR